MHLPRFEKYRRFMPLFWPAFVEQVLAVFIGIISMIMVADAGESAVAGVGLISTLNYTVMSLFLSVATGATVAAAHSIGRDDRAETRKISSQSITLVVYISIAVGLLMIIFDRTIINALFGAAESEVLDSARTYLFYSSVSMPLLAFYSTANGILRASGNMKVPMAAAVTSIISNIAVASIAIYGFGMGVAGAGLGIVAFRAAPVIFLGVYIKRGHSVFAGFKPALKLDRRIIKPVLDVAVPAGIDSVIFNGCKMVVQVFMSGMGTDVLAAYAILIQLAGLANLPGLAFQVLVTSFAGQAYGAGDIKGARRDTWRLNNMAVVFTLTACLLIFALTRPLTMLFNPTDAVYTMARNGLWMFLVLCPVFWPLSFVIPSGLRAMGMAKYTMCVSIVSMLLLRVFCAWFLGVHLNWMLYGIWIAMFLDWVGRGAFFAGALLRKRSRGGH